MSSATAVATDTPDPDTQFAEILRAGFTGYCTARPVEDWDYDPEMAIEAIRFADGPTGAGR